MGLPHDFSMAEGDEPVQLPAYAAGPGGPAQAAARAALPVRPGPRRHPGRLPRDCPGDKVCMQCCGTGTGTLIKWNHKSSHRHSIKLCTVFDAPHLTFFSLKFYDNFDKTYRFFLVKKLTI
jgi:hypothetical protein